MSAAIPTTEPLKFVAGDSLSFTKSLADYSAADGWSLTYAFRGFNLSLLDVTSTDDGSDHLVTITAEQSAALTPGVYSVAGYAINGAERVRIFNGRIEVEQDLLSAVEGADTRTYWRKVYDGLKAVLEKKSRHDILTSKVIDTEIGRLTPKQFFEFWDRALTEVAVEDDAASGRSRVIYTTFTKPR